MGEDTTSSDVVAKLMLTEAGWCEKCKDDWDNEDNGCKDMKKEKEDNCEYNNKNSRKYSGSSSTTSSSDSDTPTSAPNEDTTTTTTSSDSDTQSPIRVERRGLRGAM